MTVLRSTILPSLLTVVVCVTWEELQGPPVGIFILRARAFCLPLVGRSEEPTAASIGAALVGVRYLEDSAQGEKGTCMWLWLPIAAHFALNFQQEFKKGRNEQVLFHIVFQLKTSGVR